MANLLNSVMRESSTFQTIQALKNDTLRMRDTLIGGYRSTTQHITELKQSNPYMRKLLSWFDTQSDVDASDVLEESDDWGSDSTVVLNQTKLAEIMHAQQSEMHRVAKQKIETQIQTTSEIVKTIDDRSVDIITSLQHTSSYVSDISKKLDILIQANMTMAEKARREELSIYDKNSQTTFASLVNYFKSATKTNSGSLMKKVMHYFKIDELDQRLNDSIKNFQSKIVDAFFSIPKMKELFGYGKGYANKNYGSYVENDYTREQALFDNATRHSIVSIIPSYLKLITHQVTGNMFHVTEEGQLSKSQPRGFSGLVTKAFDISGMRDSNLTLVVQKATSQDQSITEADVKEVERILISQYVLWMYQTGVTRVDEKMFAYGGDGSIRTHVLDILTASGKGSREKWGNVLTAIVGQLTANANFRKNFAQVVNQCSDQLHRAARQYAIQSDGSERMVFTQEMFDRIALERLRYGTARFEHEGKSYRQLVRAGVVKRSDLTQEQLKHYNDKIDSFGNLNKNMRFDAMRDTSILANPNELKLKLLDRIYSILNRGINVYSINRNKAFGRMKLQQTSQLSSVTDSQKESKPKPVQQSSPIVVTPPKQFSLKGLMSKIPSKILDKVSDIAGKVANAFDPDRMKQKEALASIKASAADGTLTDDEVAQTETSVSQIKDDKTKTKLRNVIDRLRSGLQKVSAQKSPLGKAFMAVWLLGKSMISKYFSLSKKLIISFGKKALPFIMKSLKSSLKKITSGASAVKEGIKGIGQNIKSFGKTVGSIPVNWIKAFQYNRQRKQLESNDQKENERWLMQRDAELAKQQKDENAVKRHDADEQKRKADVERSEQKEAEAAEKEAERAERIQAKMKNKQPSKFMDKLKNSEFLKGVSSVYSKRKKIIAKSLEDQNSNAVESMLKKQSADHLSFFGMIASMITDLGEHVQKWFDAIRDRVSERRKLKEEKKKENEKTKAKKSFGFNLGKLVGGMLSAMEGIMQAMATVIATLKGATKLMDLIQSILEKSLLPLNKVFRILTKNLKPILKSIQAMLTTIVTAVTAIVQSVVQIIQPLFEAIGPILEQIMSVLEPILNMLSDLISLLVVPLVAILRIYIIPRIKFMANNLQIQLGIFQVGFGLILTLLGGILTACGYIAKIFGGKSLLESGKNMMDMGINMTTSGVSNVVTGMKNQVLLIGDVASAVIDTVKPPTEEKQETNRISTSEQWITYNGSPMDGVAGSGDTPIEFSDTVQEALGTLREIVGGIVNIFTGDDSVSASLKNENEKNAYKQSQIETEAKLTDDEKQQVDSQAFELFKTDYPQEPDESDKDYKKRYESKKARYWTQAATNMLKEKVKQSPGGTNDAFTTMLNESVGDSGFLSGFADTFGDIDSQVQQGSGVSAFADTMATQQSYGGQTYIDGYDKEDLIKSMAEIIYAYMDKNTQAEPYHDTAAKYKITLRNGKTRNIRPDCSGTISAAIQELGFTIKVGGQDVGEEGLRSWQFAGPTTNTLIYDKSGQLSKDWVVLPFSTAELQRGDITAGYWKSHGHVSLPVINTDTNKPKGLDAGGNSNLRQSYKAAVAYLNGEENVPWRDAMGASWAGNSAQKIWRYVGKPVTRYVGSNAEGVNMGERDIFKYLVHNLGMSEIGAAGIMGILYHESGMHSNNLEDEYNKSRFFGMSDEEYTKAVDTGKESEQQFIYGRYYKRASWQTAGEAVGYGLSQFTSSDLKRDLYTRTIKKGKSIADVPSQLDLLSSRLRGTKYNGTTLFNAISNAKTATQANQYFLWRFAAGTGFNSDAEVLQRYSSWMKQSDIDKRHRKAEDYLAALHGSGDMSSDYQQSIIINNFYNNSYDLSGHIDSILYATYDVESQPIKELVASIFDEFPEYIEDDDDDFYFDDAFISTLANVFV